MGKTERLTAGAAAHGTAAVCHATGGKPGRVGSTARVMKASGAI
jgi:hypothetical protein